ncbi:MFS polyamine transporter [Cyathus striatus]|nr:MFS polyamine transporter [Cyathus striatus]
MPSEPFEAELASPPILSAAQEEEYRILDQEGPLTRQSSKGTVVSGGEKVDLNKLAAQHEKEGYHIVSFEKGAQEDPREWTNSKKWFITISTAFLCLAVALGSSLITGDMRGPTAELGTKQIITNLTVTCFVIGFGIGDEPSRDSNRYGFFQQRTIASLSEVYVAVHHSAFFVPIRSPRISSPMSQTNLFPHPQTPLLAPSPKYSGAGPSKNAATLVVARQIAGIAASAPVCNVVEARCAYGRIQRYPLRWPLLGPMIGGWIGERAGWRWMYWVLFIFTGACFGLTFFIPETLAPVLLRKKAERLRKETGDDKHCTLQELERKPFSETLKIALVRPFVMLFLEPIVLFMSFYLSFVYSLLYLMFFAFPIAFEEIRGFSGGMTGLTFISIMLGILAAMGVVPYQEKLYARVTKNGTFPEARLYPMMLGAFVFPAALFIFAFTGAYPSVHWIAPCIAGTVFGFGMILLYISANSYIIDSYSDFAATAMAAKTFMRSEVGAMVPLFVTPMFHNMGFQYAGLLLALVGCAIAPMPFIFYRYGGAIRARSKRASPNQRIRDEDLVCEKKVLAE